MTGWEIAVDLVRRLAVLEGEDPGGDPAAWYLARHGDDVDYSRLLEALAPAPGDRQALLDSYFEPSEADVEEGLKQPTKAHRAVASLIRGGYTKVVITTNFDRLVERALQESGIDPLVVASARDAKAAPPLHAVRCVIVKVHGDRASPDLRNTLAELASYDDDLREYLERLLNEHGLVVCGWSGDWDPALRELVQTHESSLFATFWAHRGEPSQLAADLIKCRIAHPIAITDADTFFETVASQVQALEELAAVRPDSAEVRLAEVKRFLPNPIHRVRLHDLVMDDVERMIDATADDSMPVSGRTTPEDYMARLGDIEQVALPGAQLLANLAYYGDEQRHDALVARALTRLASREAQHSGSTWLIPLQWYPALLALYSVGVAALAAGRPRPFAHVLATGRVRDAISGDEESLAYKLAPGNVLQIDVLKAQDEFARRHTPASDLLHSRLRTGLTRLLPNEFDYDGIFDDVEYIFGLAVWDWTNRWAPFGRFQWRRTDGRRRGARDGSLERYGTELLSSGLFSGSADRLNEVHDAYEQHLSKIWLH